MGVVAWCFRKLIGFLEDLFKDLKQALTNPQFSRDNIATSVS